MVRQKKRGAGYCKFENGKMVKWYDGKERGPGIENGKMVKWYDEKKEYQKSKMVKW